MTLRLRNLIVVLALSTLLTAAGGVIATYRAAAAEFRDLSDDDLETQSRVLARLFATAPRSPSRAELSALLARLYEPDDEETLWVNVYDMADGELSSNLPHTLDLEKRASGDIELRHDGHAWSGYQHRAGDIVVQMLRRDDYMDELRGEVLEEILAPMMIGSGINLTLIAMLAAFFLWPLARLVRAIERRGGNLLTPIDVATPAGEMTLLRDTLNRLLLDLDELVRRERQFTDDIAHELRTPLTTLKVELADANPDRAVLLGQVDRLARVIERLLVLARLAQGGRGRDFAPIDLADLALRRVAAIAPAAAAAGIAVTARAMPCKVVGDATLLGLLLDNLLTNVLQHCPHGTHAAVSTAFVAGRAVMRVSDDGPGLPAGLSARMAEGFTRLDSRGGLGLGLALCVRIAEVHGARLKVATPDHTDGLAIEVIFDSTAAAASPP